MKYLHSFDSTTQCSSIRRDTTCLLSEQTTGEQNTTTIKPMSFSLKSAFVTRPVPPSPLLKMGQLNESTGHCSTACEPCSSLVASHRQCEQKRYPTPLTFETGSSLEPVTPLLMNSGINDNLMCQTFASSGQEPS